MACCGNAIQPMGFVSPVPVQVQYQRGSAMTAFTPSGIVSGLVSQGSASQYQAPVTSIGPLAPNQYTLSNAAPVSPEHAGLFSASLISSSSGCGAQGSGSTSALNDYMPVPAFPNVFSVQTAGPKYGITMGALPSGINPVGSTVLNSVGVFSSCPGARNINQF